jgi:hypothetical protein
VERGRRHGPDHHLSVRRVTHESPVSPDGVIEELRAVVGAEVVEDDDRHVRVVGRQCEDPLGHRPGLRVQLGRGHPKAVPLGMDGVLVVGPSVDAGIPGELHAPRPCGCAVERRRRHAEALSVNRREHVAVELTPAARIGGQGNGGLSLRDEPEDRAMACRDATPAPHMSVAASDSFPSRAFRRMPARIWTVVRVETPRETTPSPRKRSSREQVVLSVPGHHSRATGGLDGSSEEAPAGVVVAPGAAGCVGGRLRRNVAATQPRQSSSSASNSNSTAAVIGTPPRFANRSRIVTSWPQALG